MMRLTWATLVAILAAAPAAAQQTEPTANNSTPSYARQPPAAPAGVAEPAARVAAKTDAPAAPFPPLDAAAHAQLQEVLNKWQQQSQGTKTLECKFTRWHYDMFAAPAGVHARRADGVIKYGAPDKGLFRVDRLLFYAGLENNQPQYKEQEGQFGDYWVCNGEQLFDYDRSKQECRIQDLPPGMQGQNIISSPLPFVFNLDAAQVQQRYWVRMAAPPGEGMILIEAWPKRQEDRAQYKLVQIVLDGSNFLPQGLKMYAPNFDAKTAPRWDVYEFSDVKRNAIGAAIQGFLRNFIPQKPPADWKVLRDKFTPPVDPPVQQAANPAAQKEAVR